MAKTLGNVDSYESAVAFLDGRDVRKISNNTYIRRRSNGDIGVLLHSTYIVTYIAGTADIVLSSGGWMTGTTKDRMNEHTPMRFSISQVRGDWFVHDRYCDRTITFFDGIILKGDPRGQFVWNTDKGGYVFVSEEGTPTN